MKRIRFANFVAVASLGLTTSWAEKDATPHLRKHRLVGVEAVYNKGNMQKNFDPNHTGPNIILDFQYNGDAEINGITRSLEAVIFKDQMCLIGNEVADSNGTYANPPFDVLVDNNDDVLLDAHYDNWVNASIWSKNVSANTGWLEFCCQFQVWFGTMLVNFVDVAVRTSAPLELPSDENPIIPATPAPASPSPSSSPSTEPSTSAEPSTGPSPAPETPSPATQAPVFKFTQEDLGVSTEVWNDLLDLFRLIRKQIP
jgi:hypothetical protein